MGNWKIPGHLLRGWRAKGFSTSILESMHLLVRVGRCPCVSLQVKLSIFNPVSIPNFVVLRPIMCSNIASTCTCDIKIVVSRITERIFDC